tara:strand:- start:2968 stop:3294 length:327 start_codon:yes stop_codon:yes gene_type:complete
MNKFEVVFILSPDLSTNKLNDEIVNFKSMLKSEEVSVINEENWGLRDFSYTISKFNKGFYFYLQIEASGKIIRNLNKNLNQSENLIRYLFIKVKEHQELPTKLSYEKK